MRPIRGISVLIPTFQGMEFLERVLDALAAQRSELPWDLRAVDSGSSDGTFECLTERARGFPVPFAVERIDPVEFDHGDTRNRLAARSSGELSELGGDNQMLVLNGVFEPAGSDDPLAEAMARRGRKALSEMPHRLAVLPRATIPLKPRQVLGVEALRAFLADEAAAAPSSPSSWCRASRTSSSNRAACA